MLLAPPKRHPFAKAVIRLASTQAGIWVFSRLAVPTDRLALWLTGGRTTLTELLAGLATIELTTKGARTGRMRKVYLLGIPMDERIILIASSWGRKRHPDWLINLRANPLVSVAYRRRSLPYRAAEVSGQERAECWQRALAYYPSYQLYQERAGERLIPVVLLTPD